MLVVDFSWWQQLVNNPMTWLLLGAICCWSLLTVLPQKWTDWVTRQEYFGFVLGIVGLAFLAFLVLPNLTVGTIIGVLGSIIFFVAALKWWKKFRIKKEKKEEEKK